MLWLLALATVALVASAENKNPPPAPVGNSGHVPLNNVDTFEVLTYTVLVGQDEEGNWDWRAWLTTVFESRDEIDGLEEGQGFDWPTREEAEAEARAWAESQLRGPLGTSVPVEPAITRRGVRVSGDGSAVSVTDIDAWIAHAAPIIKGHDVESPQADDIMRLTLHGAFPERGFDSGASPSIRGQSWEKTRERVQAVIDKILAGELLSVQPLEEVVAARVLNMSAPTVEGASAFLHTGANNGNEHAIVVRPMPSGDAAWWVWQGPRRDWDDAAQVGTARDTEEAKGAAKAWADAYYNVGVSTS